MSQPSPREIRTVVRRLKNRYPGPGAMEIADPYRALVAVLLSARTRDEQVLKLLPGFFLAFPDVKSLAAATEGEIQAKINTIGMYKQKAKHLGRLAERMVNVFEGRIPETMEDLTSLAGVGRKTASVILPHIFQKPALAVDTHVHRVTNRLGWVHTKTPAQTEASLLPVIPKDILLDVNRVFVKHGRYVCIGKPRCWTCPLVDVCAYKNKNLQPPKNALEIEKTLLEREERLQALRKGVGTA